MLTASAQLGQLSTGFLAEDDTEVGIPLAQIHPLILIPGILGTMPPSERWWQGQIDPVVGIYRPLLTNLQKMGYELGTTLQPMPYDWRQSNQISADRLDEKIDETLDAVEDIPYVNHDGKIDLVVHSMGGLVTRAYVQGAGIDDENGNAPITYDGDIRKVIFIATPHKGFPITYKTWEGLSWDDYMYEDNQKPLRFLMNKILWPQWIEKKYGWLEALDYCEWECEREDWYYFSHHPTKGVVSLRQMLPTDDLDNYLCSQVGADGCLGDPYPYGGPEANTWLENLNATITTTLGDRLGTDNIYVIYGDEVMTDFWYEVKDPADYAPLWQYGKPKNLGVSDDDLYEKPEGDDLIPRYSTSLDEYGGLLDLPPDNEARLRRDEARHKEIMYHDSTQREHVPKFLTGQTVPFTTTYSVPWLLIDPRQWLVLTSLCPVDLMITDPQGRRVGYDPATGQVVNEIPGAVYSAPGLEMQFIIVPDPIGGQYEVTATGFEAGEYVLTLHDIDRTGVRYLATFSGTAAVGQVHTHSLEYTPPAPLIFFDDFERGDGTDPGPDWLELSGDWGIVDGQLHILTAGYDQAVAVNRAFTETNFVLETKVRGIGQGSGSGDHYLFAFGADAAAQTGYAVMYSPKRHKLYLLKEQTPLAQVSVHLENNVWYGLRVMRAGSTGVIAVYLDQGDGYPDEPLLWAVDTNYPALGQFGWLVRSDGYDFYVDEVKARELPLPPPIFADDFERPDSSDLGSDWVELSGDWDIVEGQLHIQTADYDQAVVTADSFAETDFIIEARAKGLGQGSKPGDHYLLVFGADATAQTGYAVMYNPKQHKLYLLREQTPLAQASIHLKNDTWYGLKVVREGNSGEIEVYLDEGGGYPSEPILRATDTTYPPLGQLGWMVKSGGYDFCVDWITVAHLRLNP